MAAAKKGKPQESKAQEQAPVKSSAEIEIPRFLTMYQKEAIPALTKQFS